MSPSAPRDRRGFEIAIVCALPVEADAVHSVFDKFYKNEGKNYGQASGDYNRYTTGVIGDHNVVLAYMPGMGNLNAAGVSAGLRTSFTHIKLGLIVGICGGVPSTPDGRENIILGDIVFSTGVIQYDFGRQYPKELRRKETVEESPGKLPRRVRGFMEQLKTKMYRENLQNTTRSYLESLQSMMPEAKYPGLELDLLFEASYLHKHHGIFAQVCQECNADTENICEDARTMTCSDLKCEVNRLVERSKIKDGQARPPAHSPTIHFGLIGSGNAVMRSGEHRDRIATATGVIAFEMEGAGVWDIFDSVIIKGVCDYADSHKNKKWQKYAAATAASGMKAFLQQWRITEEEEAAMSQAVWHVPLRAKQEFVGRRIELEMLESKLFHTESSSRAAVFGLGGIGKTRIAMELVYRTKEHHPTYSIFWVQAMNSLTFDKHVLEIGRALNIRGIDDEKADVKNLVKQRLSQPNVGEWLMILDNADDEEIWGPMSASEKKNEHLTRFLPERGRILVTTRSRHIAAYIAGRNSIELPEMSQGEAVATLKSALIEPEILDRADTVSRLVEKLTFLPLAIVQAAAYINMNNVTIQDYLDLLEDTEENVVDLLSEDFGDYDRYSEGQNPVASTWLISFDKIRLRRPRVAEYLAFISCLSEKSIPLSLLPNPVSKKEMLEVVGTLTGYSFLRKQTEFPANESLYQMHRLVRLATRNWLRKQSLLSDSIRRTLSIVEERFPFRTHENRDECALYMPHAQTLCNSESTLDLEERYSLMEKMGIHLSAEVKFTDALRLLRSVVNWREENREPTHLTTLRALNNYGVVLTSVGDYGQAKLHCERAFEGRKHSLGLNHKSTLESMAGLARSYQLLGQLGQAELLGFQLMEASTSLLGPEDPVTLRYMADFVWTLYKKGSLHEAEELGLQVKHTRMRVLSEEHSDTVTSMSYLGAIYLRLGQFLKATELAETVLEIRTRVLGREHPATLGSMVNLAMTYRGAGKLDEAEVLQVEGLRAAERVLGIDHPITLRSMHSLAWIWHEQERYDEATELMKRCISLSTQKLGYDHPTTQERRCHLEYLIEKATQKRD